MSADRATEIPLCHTPERAFLRGEGGRSVGHGFGVVKRPAGLPRLRESAMASPVRPWASGTHQRVVRTSRSSFRPTRVAGPSAWRCSLRVPSSTRVSRWTSWLQEAPGRFAMSRSPGVNKVELNAVNEMLAAPAWIRYLKREKPRSAMSMIHSANLMSGIGAVFAPEVPLIVNLRIAADTHPAVQWWWRKWFGFGPEARLYKRAARVVGLSQGVADEAVRVFGVPEGTRPRDREPLERLDGVTRHRPRARTDVREDDDPRHRTLGAPEALFDADRRLCGHRRRARSSLGHPRTGAGARRAYRAGAEARRRRPSVFSSASSRIPRPTFVARESSRSHRGTRASAWR